MHYQTIRRQQRERRRQRRETSLEYARKLGSAALPYPKSQSEFEIQAHLFQRLSDLGYAVRGCVRCVVGFCDLVVYDKKRRPLLVIEVKRDAFTTENEIERYKLQLQAYRAFGLPIAWVTGMKQARKFIRLVEADGLPEEDYGCDKLH